MKCTLYSIHAALRETKNINYDSSLDAHSSLLDAQKTKLGKKLKVIYVYVSLIAAGWKCISISASTPRCSGSKSFAWEMDEINEAQM